MWAREFHARTLMSNFTIVTFIMWAYSAQNSQKCYFFGIILQKGIYPLSDFYQIWLGGGSQGVPGPHPHAKLHRCGLKVWAKNWYFLV